MIAQATSLSDADMAGLAERIQCGDSGAETELAQIYSKRVFIMLLARTHDREVSRDLTQDVLIAVLQALRDGHVRQPGHLGAFVYGTARNLLNNYFRSCRQQPDVEPVSDDLAVATTDDPEIVVQVNKVRDLLKRIDAVDRKILLMTLVEGYKAEEVAFQLNLSSEAVRQRKSRAIKKIVERLRKTSRK